MGMLVDILEKKKVSPKRVVLETEVVERASVSKLNE